MINLTLAIVIVAAASALCWQLIRRCHTVSPVLLFIFSVWVACGVMAPEGKPLFQSSLQITKSPDDRGKNE